jgi:putative oxidoreductase
MKERSRVVTVIVWVLQILAAAVFLSAGGSKLLGAAAMIQLFDAIGAGQWFRYVTGAIEVSSAILLLLPSRAVFGSILLAGTMAGAILTHLVILHSSPAGPVVLLIVVVIITWLRWDQIRSAARQRIA